MRGSASEVTLECGWMGKTERKVLVEVESAYGRWGWSHDSIGIVAETESIAPWSKCEENTVWYLLDIDFKAAKISYRGTFYDVRVKTCLQKTVF